MIRALAKWLVVRLGNLAMRLAPYAGVELTLGVGRNAQQKMARTRLVDVPEPGPFHDIRVTCVHRGGQYVMGWRVRGETPEAAVSMFCARFIPEGHQGSRRTW